MCLHVDLMLILKNKIKNTDITLLQLLDINTKHLFNKNVMCHKC